MSFEKEPGVKVFLLTKFGMLPKVPSILWSHKLLWFEFFPKWEVYKYFVSLVKLVACNSKERIYYFQNAHNDIFLV